MKYKGMTTILAVCAAGALVFSLFLGLPAAVYGTNDTQFSAPFLNLALLYWPWAVGAAALMVIPTILLPERAGRVWAAISVVVAIYVWAHGTFQTHNFGEIDGRGWSASVPEWQWILDAAVSLVAALAVFLLAKKAPKAVSILCVVIAGGAVVQALPLLDGYNGERSAGKITEIAQFNTESNSLVILLDTLQSDVFEEVVFSDPVLRSAFDGFLFFPDTVGAAPTTYLSMPTIHSGMTYDGETVLRDYFEEAVGQRSVLSVLAAAGYKSDLINPILRVCPVDVECHPTRAALVGDEGEYQAQANRLLDAVLFRVSPLGLKDAVYNEGEWVLQAAFADHRFVQFAVEGNSLLSEFAQKADARSPVPTSKFVHLFTTHPPYVYENGCIYAGRELPISAENDRVQARCALLNVASVLERLGEIGVYDNTAIAVIADHGNFLLQSRRASSPSRASIIGSANPTFAFKPIGSRGPIESRSTQIHIGDLGATICDTLEVCDAPLGRSALNEGEPRARVFQNYKWRNDYWTSANLDVDRYDILGPVGEMSSWSWQTPPLPRGEPVSVSQIEGIEDILINGWSGMADWGAWSVADAAYLAVSVPDDGAHELVIQTRGFVPEATPSLKVVVFHGDVELMEAEFTPATRTQLLAVPLPSSVTGTIELEFRIDEPVSPKSLGLSEDARELGIGIEAIALSSGR